MKKTESILHYLIPAFVLILIAAFLQLKENAEKKSAPKVNPYETEVHELFKDLEARYNVKVVYLRRIDSIKFEGKIPHSAKLTSILKILQANSIYTKYDSVRKIVEVW